MGIGVTVAEGAVVMIMVLRAEQRE